MIRATLRIECDVEGCPSAFETRTIPYGTKYEASIEEFRLWAVRVGWKLRKTAGLFADFCPSHPDGPSDSRGGVRVNFYQVGPTDPTYGGATYGGSR